MHASSHSRLELMPTTVSAFWQDARCAPARGRAKSTKSTRASLRASRASALSGIRPGLCSVHTTTRDGSKQRATCPLATHKLPPCLHHLQSPDACKLASPTWTCGNLGRDVPLIMEAEGVTHVVQGAAEATSYAVATVWPLISSDWCSSSLHLPSPPRAALPLELVSSRPRSSLRAGGCRSRSQEGGRSPSQSPGVRPCACTKRVRRLMRLRVPAARSARTLTVWDLPRSPPYPPCDCGVCHRRQHPLHDDRVRGSIMCIA